jgi:hypothetical protein
VFHIHALPVQVRCGCPPERMRITRQVRSAIKRTPGDVALDGNKGARGN